MELDDFLFATAAAIIGGGLAPLLVKWLRKKGLLKSNDKTDGEFDSGNNNS